MSEEAFERMKSEGVPLLSRKIDLALWIDGYPLSDFRRALEVYTAIDKLSPEVKEHNQ